MICTYLGDESILSVIMTFSLIWREIQSIVFIMICVSLDGEKDDYQTYNHDSGVNFVSSL